MMKSRYELKLFGWRVPTVDRDSYIGLLNMNKVALIIGAGPGISLSFAKELVSAGYTVALINAQRNWYGAIDDGRG